jgi:iduronate 2-sulfatase
MRIRWLVSLALAALYGQIAAAAPPNVLLICVDDLKPVLGCYGDPLAKSPNIDRLAASGLRFDAAYCNQAVCAPSRNSLLTGLRPQSIGVYDLGTFFRRAAPDAVTLPQHFKNNGYKTQGLGKIFHVGHGNHEDPASWSVPHWRSEVVKYYVPANKPPAGQTREEALFSNVPGAKANKLPRGAAYEAADVPDNAYPDGELADEAVKRLEQAAKKPDQPFFIAVGFVKPHLPFCAPKKYWDLHERAAFTPAEIRQPPAGAPDFAPTNWGELRNYANIPNSGDLSDDLQRTLIHGYYAATSYMDAQVGRVLDALYENGLEKNTIVVLWGDHGWHLGDHGMWCKHTNYEQAARIPLIIVAPGIAPGAVTEALAESVDLYPTLCELTGVAVPAELDGKSLAPVLRDPASSIRQAATHVFPRGNRIGRAVRTDRYRLVQWKPAGAEDAAAVLELYDYQDDPQETKNLASERPEVVAELLALLAEQPEAKPQFRQPAKGNVAKDRRPRPGRAAPRQTEAAR